MEGITLEGKVGAVEAPPRRRGGDESWWKCFCRRHLAAEQPARRQFRPEPDALMQFLLNNHPIGPIAQPEEIANAILFLASDEASFVIGASLAVDGGYTAQ